jgi:allantoinase
VLEPSHLHYRHKITPYAGRALAGVVETTFLRGRKVYDRGEFCAGSIGCVLHRGCA